MLSHDEIAAIDMMRDINRNMVEFINRWGVAEFPEIPDLIAEGLIDADSMKVRSAYRFEITATGLTYVLTAIPNAEDVTASMHFFSNEDAIVHFEVGKPAGPDSPRVN